MFFNIIQTESTVKVWRFARASWIFLFIFGSYLLQAQQIEVNTANASIREKSIAGYTACLELDVKSVENGLSKFVRSLGKFEKAERNAWEGLTQIIPAVSSDAIDFYAKLMVSPRCVQVFMGAVRSGTSNSVSAETGDNIRKMLYDFSLEQYRSDLRKQIEEADRVVNLAVKAHDKRTREADDLKYRLGRNRKEKIKLMENMESNRYNLQKLLSDSVRNAAEKETALEEIKKVRQIAEERKQKLGLIK
jgi:hypothetical protein